MRHLRRRHTRTRAHDWGIIFGLGYMAAFLTFLLLTGLGVIK